MGRLNKKEEKIFNKRRMSVINHLNRLEKKYGYTLLRSAMGRKMNLDREIRFRKKLIAQKERELNQLKSGRLI